MSGAAALALFVGACVMAALPGALIRPGAWYAGLRKPRWRPPDWLFGPAWTVLYLMIAVSGWLVWRQLGLRAGALPLTVYGLHLAINAGWSAIFFGLRRMDLAFGWIVLLWASILAMILVFAPVDGIAALLGWVSFAAMLNWSVWRMNRGSGGRASPAHTLPPGN